MRLPAADGPPAEPRLVVGQLRAGDFSVSSDGTKLAYVSRNGYSNLWYPESRA